MPETSFNRCTRISALGTPCDLEAGHGGKHQKTYHEAHGPRTVSWDDEGDRRFLEGQQDKRLGT